MSVNIEAEKRAYRKFLAAGMTPEGACGLIGNLEAESDGFVFNRVEYLCIRRLKEAGKTYTDQSYTAAIDAGKISAEEFLHPLPGKQYGYGLAQWTSPTRKSGLYTLARRKGVSIADEDMQIEFLLSELEGDYSGVLKVLKTATNVRAASDAVLKKFECPADTGAAMCASRAARGQKFYDSYVKGAKKVGVRVSNCGHDERSKYSGGVAGDQSGTEWYLREWYSYPWNYVLRWKDRELGNLFADLAVEAAENDKIGYDQSQRDTFLTQLRAAGWRPKKIKTACEADCSSGVVALIKAVGNLKGIAALKNCSATYTGDMMTWFQSANGKKYFDVLTGKHLTDAGVARRGDINLNTAHHVNITVDDGANAGKNDSAASAGNDSAALVGKCSVELKTFLRGAKDPQVKSIQILLNAKGYMGRDGRALSVDGELGENTAYAIERLQKDAGMSGINFGTVAAKTWQALLS